MTTDEPVAADTRSGDLAGLPYAVMTYFIWGLFPIFFKLLESAPPLEVMVQRVIWSLPLCLAILYFRKEMGEFFSVFRDKKALRLLVVSSLLIGCNWLLYIYAVFTGHVIAASLGYYLNPLMNVLLATLFLGERLSRLQLLAVCVAAVGVATLLAGALDTLWISVILASSFAFYGLLRKIMPVNSLPSLAVETTILMPISLVVGLYYIGLGDGRGFGSDAWMTGLMIASGVVTALPLLSFAKAARLMNYTTLGFVQYLAPTLLFFLGLFLFKEPLKPVQIFCFALIWISIAIFSFDMWRKRKQALAG
ncbi:EamA family transporter RarD [Sphingopyxis yananensis]|uniref:EamA family transporter RarD n=1 Tax=Sphingopyxis yananensis TaxID=2886687 RepID=UPI001D12551C|nr:EamA family transporter RarD [Sphingopyxis yananensis]MCC2602170.1 EamA family transporter RarD [Sphingopyxis yananensis]